MVLLSCLFAAAAYFDAWTYVNTTSGRSLLEPWQDAALHFSWFLLTAYLVGVMAVNVRRGLPIARSLPAGYGWSFVGCVGFSAMVSSMLGREPTVADQRIPREELRALHRRAGARPGGCVGSSLVLSFGTGRTTERPAVNRSFLP